MSHREETHEKIVDLNRSQITTDDVCIVEVSPRRFFVCMYPSTGILTDGRKADVWRCVRGGASGPHTTLLEARAALTRWLDAVNGGRS